MTISFSRWSMEILVRGLTNDGLRQIFWNNLSRRQIALPVKFLR